MKTYNGILLPSNNTSKEVGIFARSYTTHEQAVSNFINLLLTIPGERVMQPNFGIGIQRKLFEQSTSLLEQEIEFDVRQQAGYWLPYIEIIKLTVTNNTKPIGINNITDNYIYINIEFKVGLDGANKVINIYTLDGKPQVRLLE